MNKFVKNLAISATVSCAFLLSSSGAYAWAMKDDCEGVSKNMGLFSLSSYSSEQAASGSKSCKLGIAQGTDGWGSWGGTYTFPTKLNAGSELWIRVSLYVPEGFNYTANPWLKFMRVHTASPSVSNQGYLDLYMVPDNQLLWDPNAKKDVYAPFDFYYEGKAITRPVGKAPTNNIVKGKWETYEIYYKLDSRSKDAGGTGEVRIWKNNVLLNVLTDQQTLVDAQTYAESFYLFTYWNGGAPATQSLYVDDIVISSDTPSNRDANGYAFIGGSTVPSGTPAPTPVAAPVSPSNLTVKPQ